MQRAHVWSLAIVVLIAFALRLAVALPRLSQVPEDPDNYLPLAASVAAGDGLRFHGRLTAYRPPLYPIALAPLVKMLGTSTSLSPAVVVFHAILGAATVIVVAMTALFLSMSPARALLASLIVAVDPVLVVQSRSVMTETMAAALLAAALCALARDTARSTMVGGFFFGLLALCRPSMLAAWAMCVVAAAWFAPSAQGLSWKRALSLICPTLLVLMPWGLRNLAVLGAPALTTTHGGYTLYLANNPVYYREVVNGPPGAVWSGAGQRAWFEQINRAARGLSEPEADRYFRDQALGAIRKQPLDFLRASIARLGRFWGVAPADAVYPALLRIATALWTVPFWVAVIVAACQRSSWRWPLVSAIAVVIGLTLVHSVFWTDLRMRAPIVPALAILAAQARVPRVRRAEPRSRDGRTRLAQGH